ncbi:MAG: selenium metabolism-associated LysR family transcriptional regulator [Dehalococcoidia bacterium]|nr:selenium metabolism-associated LysR family transcriptional regulator [Dehalococcoidia bacterium]
MDIKQLKTFCAVAEKKSFSLAGETLGLTQPTISFQIASLEQELQTKLFDRGGRITTLTRGGEILHRYASQVLALTLEAEQSIRKLQGLFWGEVSVGASTIPGEYILPRLLQKFKEAHPGIVITMAVGDTKSIADKVLASEVEVGVVGASEKNEKLTFARFVTDELVLIAPARNSWFAAEKATLEELKRVPFIAREIGSGTRTIAQQKLRESGLSVDDLNIAMTLGSTTAVKVAVESGAGVSIVSRRAVQHEIKLGLIKVMDIEGLELRRDFFVVHRKLKVLSPAAEALLQFLGEQR